MLPFVVVNMLCCECHFISTKEGCGSEIAVPETQVSRDISTIRYNSRGEGFYGGVMFIGLRVVRHLHAVDICRLECRKREVE